MYPIKSLRSHLTQLLEYSVLVSAGIGILGVLLAISSPKYFIAALIAATVTTCFVTYFEQTLICLLILRSSLDIFSSQGIPAIYAIGIGFLAVLHVVKIALIKKKIFIDPFLCFFCIWVFFQGLWVLLSAIGALGLGVSYLSVVLPEWIRIFVWFLTYLIVFQLQGSVKPENVVNMLMLSLCVPLLIGGLQVVIPESMLPELIAPKGGVFSARDIADAIRTSGTFGHANAFASYLVLFCGLAFWKIQQSTRKLPWAFLLGIIIFFIVSTKALVGLMMLSCLIVFIALSKISLRSTILSVLALAGIIVLFGSTEFGQERLQLFSQLPYINPDIDTSRAIILRNYVNNSFYWRVDQWTALIEVWKQSPMWGYGFDTARYLTHLESAAHNDYLRALVDSGIIGLLSFLTFLSALIFTNFNNAFFNFEKTRQQAQLSSVLLGVTFAMLVGMLTENIWSHTALFFYYFAVMSVSGWPSDLWQTR
jgi:O-antigen ligase